MMRLDKYLCDAKVGTRSQVKGILKKGNVLVNGEVIKKPEWKVEEGTDCVVCEGKKLTYQKYVYWMLYKPAGVVSATEDKREQTVIELLPQEERKKGIFPVGRLDKDTEGLLLLTNDGELGHRLLSPKKHVDKKYYAKVQGVVTQAHVEQFLEGLDIGEKKLTFPAKLEVIESKEISEVWVTLQEGKFHQVKRMFEAVGCKVLYLKRVAMGALVLDAKLKAGECRELTLAERKLLFIREEQR